MRRTAILFVFALALALIAGAFTGGVVNAEPTPGTQVHLPILTWLGFEADACDVVIEVQNVGNDFTKAMIFYWGEAGACPPQCNGPFKVECSGLLKPGATWNFLGPDAPAQVPPGAKKGIVFSLDVRQEDGDIVADFVCEEAFASIRQECNEYRRFKKSFEEDGGEGYFGFPVVGQPLAVEVVRKCQTATMTAPVVSAYSGIAEDMLGAFDPVFGGFAFYTPLLYADQLPGLNSWVYIQNAGLECTSVEIWLKTQGECIRSVIDEIPALAPGETYQWTPTDAGVGPFWQGNAWIRTSVPAAIVVDNWSDEVLMTYHGKPAELNFTFDPNQAFFTQGSQVNYGPLIYREHQGWDTNIQVQNLSSVVNAKVKVYFIDNSGDIIKTIVDWICPRGTQSFPLAVIDGLPGNWVGQVRVESQEWWTPGDPAVLPPNVVSIAELIRWDGPQQTVLLEGVAYNLFPEFQAYDWQVGKNWQYGVDLIGIPSFMNNMGGGGETGLTTELAIQNVVQKPGFTDFAIFIYDQNGLLDFVCEKLNEKQVEYINVADWNYINEGFKGSAVISVTTWEHHGSFSPGLAAVKVERFNWPLVPSPDPAFDAPGDQASASEGFPIFGDFHFQGPRQARCPGQPGPCTFEFFGNVQDSVTERPISGVTVRVSFPESGQVQQTTTNANGDFFLNAIAGEPFLVRVLASGYTPQLRFFNAVECSGSLQVSFSLDPTDTEACVTGNVEDKETGQPIEGARVEVFNNNITQETATSTDGFGNYGSLAGTPFCFEADPFGVTTIVVSAEGYNPSAESFILNPGDLAIQDFQLHQTPRSRVLLFFGNGGVDPLNDFEARLNGVGSGFHTYFELVELYEDLGFIVEYTDAWPSDPDLEEYKLIVLILPGFADDDTDVNGFTAGQASQLGNFIAGGGRVVLLVDNENQAGSLDDDYNVPNELLEDLGIGIRVSDDSEDGETYFKDIGPAPYDAEFDPATVQGEDYQRLDLLSTVPMYVATPTAGVDLPAAFGPTGVPSGNVVIAADKVGDPGNAPDENTSTGWDVVVIGDAQVLDDEFLTMAFPENRVFAINLISFPTAD